MNFISTFFRAETNSFEFKNFGYIHNIFLIIALIGVKYIIKNKDQVNKVKKYKSVIIYTLLIQQILLYSFYIFSGYFSIEESLPFYNCRLAIISIILGELLNKSKLKYIGVYWGLIGSIVALLSPSLDPFGYNHYTFYSFFIGHVFLLWGSIYYLAVEKLDLNDESVKKVILFSTFYHLIILIFNIRYNSNYCYLIDAPIMEDTVKHLPGRIYTLLFIFLFDLFIYLIHIVLLKIITFRNNINMDNIRNSKHKYN